MEKTNRLCMLMAYEVVEAAKKRVYSRMLCKFDVEKVYDDFAKEFWLYLLRWM